MQPSKYNVFFRVDGQDILAYNSLTTALVKLTPDEFGHLERYYDGPRPGFFAGRGLETFRDQLAEQGLLVPDGYDEVDYIALLRRALKERAGPLGLTIVPTLSCNFRCSYCFSYARQERMGPQVRQALLALVDELLPEASGFSLAWYGGEPTLCLDLIAELGAELSRLCERHGVEPQPGSIVSNGYLLDAAAARRLADSGVGRAQITLDGDRETHDGRRPHRSGKPTFDRILDNVAAICDLLKVQVRINVDRSNAGTALGALNALAARGLQAKVGVYFGHVKPFSEACGDIAATCLSDREFSDLELDLQKQAIARGFRSFRYPETQLNGVCGADKPLYFVVAPDGLLFKCWAEASLGPGASVGTVFHRQRTAEQERTLGLFLDWDPLAHDECRRCEVLPICMGGCPHLRLRHAAETDCGLWRYHLLDTLAIRYKLGDQIEPRAEHAPETVAGT